MDRSLIFSSLVACMKFGIDVFSKRTLGMMMQSRHNETNEKKFEFAKLVLGA